MVDLLHQLQQTPDLAAIVLVNLRLARKHVLDAVVQLDRPALRDVLHKNHTLVQ